MIDRATSPWTSLATVSAMLTLGAINSRCSCITASAWSALNKFLVMIDGPKKRWEPAIRYRGIVRLNCIRCLGHWHARGIIAHPFSISVAIFPEALSSNVGSLRAQTEAGQIG